jgi:hypothetical protein
MSKLKKSEAFTREREREIEQVILFISLTVLSITFYSLFDSACSEVCLLLFVA